MSWKTRINTTSSSFANCEVNIVILENILQVQVKIHEELDRVVGKSGQVTLAHKQDLPYLQATILESYRYFTTFPLSGK